MSSVGGVQSGAAAAAALNTPGQNIEVAATLLKKATQADKDLVATLLPAGGGGAGGLDIRA